VSVSRRIFITSAVAGAAAVYPHAARAAFPDRPLRLIVPIPAGGAVDVVGRLLGNALSAAIGQPVVIDNRGGAGGIIGMEASARAAPDDYSVMVSHSGFAAMPGLYRKLPFDPAKDFDSVVTAVSGSYVLAVHPSVPFRTVAELIAFAKATRASSPMPRPVSDRRCIWVSSISSAWRAWTFCTCPIVARHPQ